MSLAIAASTSQPESQPAAGFVPDGQGRQRILIVGGVAGGASAAARARRLAENAEIVIFERGEHISFANCGLPYHIGGAISDRSQLLLQTPESMRKRYRIQAQTRTEVLRIEPARKVVQVRDLRNGAEREERYDTLILSPGAAPIRPELPGIDSRNVFTLRNMADMDAIKAVVELALDAKRKNEKKVISFNFSGHGLLDLGGYQAYMDGNMT